MNKKYQKITSALGKHKMLFDVKMSDYTTMRVGGAADLFFKAQTQEDLLKAIQHARKEKVPYFVLGGGSNLIVTDKGFKGFIIKNETAEIRIIGIKGGSSLVKENTKRTQVHSVFIKIDSGVGVNRLVRFTLDQGLSGLEAFLGQPGTVGGAVWINAHNMKQKKFFGEFIHSAKILKKDGSLENVAKDYFEFDYDKSIIQKSKDIVLSVVMKLKKKDSKKLWQKGQNALNYRRSTQPQGVYSSGCIFRNISKSEAMRLATPNYTQSAGYIIDSLGLKGFQVGKSSFSPAHANFIVNSGGSSASDVLKLIKLAKRSAWEKYRINLNEEVVILGEE